MLARKRCASARSSAARSVLIEGWRLNVFVHLTHTLRHTMGVARAAGGVPRVRPVGLALAILSRAYAFRRSWVTLSAAVRPSTIAAICSPQALSAARFSSAQSWR